MIHDEHIETMRDNYDDHGAELAAKDAEIKRLRGLLREAPKHPMTESLRRRVREALGETVSYQWSTATHPYPRERVRRERVREAIGE